MNQLNTSLLVKWHCRIKGCSAKSEDWQSLEDARREARVHHREKHNTDMTPYYDILLLPPIYRDINVLTRMYWGEEMNCREIADVFKVTPTCIEQWMRKHKIPLRLESERGKLAMTKFAQEQKLKRWSGIEDKYNYQRKKNVLKLACGEEV